MNKKELLTCLVGVVLLALGVCMFSRMVRAARSANEITIFIELTNGQYRVTRIVNDTGNTIHIDGLKLTVQP